MNSRMLSLFAICLFTLGSMACKNKNYDDANAKSAGEVAAATATATAYMILPEKSTVNWEGSKPTGTHIGTIKVKNGSFSMKDGTIESGNFVLDMTTIANTDQEGKMKNNLEAHLRGSTEGKEDDFFNVAKYPEAKFEITKVTKLMNDDEATHIVNGNLTIKDVSKLVSFRANVRETGDQIIATSVPFAIDRTEWNIQFMSQKFFDNLKDNFINDEIGITVNLVAQKS